jgi:hypothetical protein
VLANQWDTVWSVGGTAPDTTLLRPFLLASTGNGVFVYDGVAKRVTAYAADGAVRWRFGRQGKGPDEFEKVRDMRVSRGGGVDLLDPRNNRIMRLNADGTVRGRIPLSAIGHAEQMVPLGDSAFVLLAEHPESAFVVMDTLGKLRERLTVAWDGFRRLESLARQGYMASSGGRWVFAFSFGDGWFACRGERPERYVGRFVEHTGFPKVKAVSTALGTAKQMDEYDACSACSISIAGSTLYVHFGGYTPVAQRVVDLYDLDRGTYRGSWVLPSVAKAVDVAGDRVYALTENPYPELIALRPRQRAP